MKPKNSLAKPWLAIGVALILVSLFVVGFKIKASQAQDSGLTDEETQTILELNQQINDKKKAIDELQAKSDLYQRTLNQKQRETLDLTNQVSIIENQILKTETDIKQNETEIEKTNLEIKQIEGLIEQRAKEIRDQQGKLGEAIRLMYRNSRKTYLEIALQNKSLSEFYVQVKGVQELEQRLKDNLDKLAELKQKLELEYQSKNDKQASLEESKRIMEQNKIAYSQEKIYQETLITKTENEQQEYQNLLSEAEAEANRVTSEVSALESRFRQKLSEENVDLNELLKAVGELAWPVAPLKGISAYFHDPSYPYRKYFEHPAIDIPTPQGTPIKAAADGIVGVVQFSGTRAYSYVSIIHGGDLSTVYGHLSSVSVSIDQYVRRGEVIGLSGGTPGTTGAGNLTTGPHLHFGILKYDQERGFPIAVDPLNYLK